jgi:hypothetical protein
MKKLLMGLLVFLLPVIGFSVDLKGNWTLEKSEITYRVKHPLHGAVGKSLSAKGKGVCYGRICKFLVAVPVKSFDSGDGNRDLHMLQTTRGADHPLVKVNVEFTPASLQGLPKVVTADLEIEFAGKKFKYAKVQLQVEPWGTDGAHITGVIPLNLKDFQIELPSLLGIPIDEKVPVQLDMYWKRKAGKK